MKNLMLYIVAAMFIINPLLLSCTKSDDTEKAGKEMADKITAPVERALNAKELVEKKYRDMEEDSKKE